MWLPNYWLRRRRGIKAEERAIEKHKKRRKGKNKLQNEMKKVKLEERRKIKDFNINEEGEKKKGVDKF